jgi:hypothetical protein
MPAAATSAPIYAAWPADSIGQVGTDWNQHDRWLILDVCAGFGRAVIIEGPMTRWEALARAAELRRARL